MNKVLLTIVAMALLLLSACREVLHSNLTEADANEMLTTLLKRGVDAKKEAAGKAGYIITVDERDFIQALEIIKEHSLPKAHFDSLGTVFSGQGMISSQTEEQARLAYAISQELAATFSKIDGVLNARVHVVLVQHEQSSGVTTPPSAAIFIRHTKESPVLNMLAGIKDTATRSVPGLTHDKVSILTEVFEETILPPKKVVKPWYEEPFGIALIALVSVIVALAIAFFSLKFLGFKAVRTARNEKVEP